MLNDEKKVRKAIVFANKIAQKYKVKKGQMAASEWLVRERESSYLEVLRRTQGVWADDDWLKTQTKRRKIELKTSLIRRKP